MMAVLPVPTLLFVCCCVDDMRLLLFVFFVSTSEYSAKNGFLIDDSEDNEDIRAAIPFPAMLLCDTVVLAMLAGTNAFVVEVNESVCKNTMRRDIMPMHCRDCCR